MEPIVPIWRLISLLLSTAIFLVVGGTQLAGGEDPTWALGKAMVAFLVGWFLLGQFGAVLCAVTQKNDDDTQMGLEEEPMQGDERG